MLCLSIDDNPDVLLRTLDNRKVDGVILARTVENDILVDILNQRGIPFSTIGSLPPQSQGSAIVEADHDQVSGCRDFTKAFLTSGTGKVGVLGNDMHYIVNQSRLRGFQNAVCVMNVSEDQIAMRTSLYTKELCTQAVNELLDLGIRRFLAMDDDMCLWVLSALNARGISIPGDAQIGSFSDSDQLINHNISALSFDAAELGGTACRELLRFLLGEEYQEKPRLGYQIAMRGST